MQYFTSLILLLFLFSCENNTADVAALADKYNTKVDIGEQIRVTYSDSGIIKVIVNSPIIERHNNYSAPKDVFPKGIKIEFKNELGETNAWLEADYAERIPFSNKMIAKGNVKLYNTAQDKLSTSELIWDENQHKVYTERFVRITRPSQRDTTYGYGFEADEAFTTLLIKRRIQSKLNAAMINGLP